MIICIDDSSVRMQETAKQLLKKNTIIALKKPMAVKNAHVLVLPIQGINDQGIIHGTSVSLVELLDLNHINKIITGVINERLKQTASTYDIALETVMNDDVFIEENSLLTSEGLLGIIVTTCQKVITDSEILILGYGKSGKEIAKLFSRIANVSVFARREVTDYTWKKSLCDLEKYDIIINTIPALILNEAELKTVKGDIYDIASAPGGVDFLVSEALGINARLELGIPGRIYPVLAGKCYGRSCERLL